MNFVRKMYGGRAALTGVLVFFLALAMTTPLFSQSEEGAADRKVLTRIDPKYPPTLERMFIGGIVRLQVDISASGTVEATQLLGGNPILGQAAMVAVKQWKYAPANHKTQQVEKLEFDPHR